MILRQEIASEKSELDDRLRRLRGFIDGDVFEYIGTEEQERLKRQFEAMSDYSLILSDRIAAMSDVSLQMPSGQQFFDV